MDLFAQFTTDPKAETEGRWFPYAGGHVLLARQFNKNHSKRFLALLEQNKAALDLKDDAADTLAEHLQAQALAEHVLLGWKGFTRPAGPGKDAPQVPLEFTPENALRALLLRDFRKGILALSEDYTNYRVKEDEDDAKNLLPA